MRRFMDIPSVPFCIRFFFQSMFLIFHNCMFRQDHVLRVQKSCSSTPFRGVAYYHPLLIRETRIPEVTLGCSQKGIWDLVVYRTVEDRDHTR